MLPIQDLVRKRASAFRKEDGQALVEFALVIPLLLFVVFAIIDFGLAINQYNDSTNLANLGARAAAVASTSTTWTQPTCTYTSGSSTQTSTSLTSYLQCLGRQDNSALANATVCPSDLTGSSWTTGDTIQIKVKTNFDWLGVLEGGVGSVGGLGGALNSNISSTATMRMEASNSSEPTWISSGASSNC